MKKLTYFFAFLLVSLSAKSQNNSFTLNSDIRRVVEIMPYFEDGKCLDLDNEEMLACGEEKMFEFIYTNLVYPEAARINKIEGKVVIRFVVEKDGRLSTFNIMKDLDFGCGLAALNVARRIEKFVPGQLKGEPVRAYYHLYVKFKLDRE